MPKLRIELESDVCCGSGLARPAEVDRDVVFDEWGLPWLPGRRLKGLLVDAYKEIGANLKGEWIPKSDGVFGRGSEVPGSLRLRNAYLEDYQSIRKWVEGFVAGEGGPHRRKAVMSTFCGVRRQTAMDRESGAPKQDTLRSTRVLRSGLVFEASVEGELSDEAVWVLAVSAAGVRAMGSSRWRGLGRVKVSLWDQSSNCTDAALKTLSAKSFSAVSRPARQVVANEVTAAPLDDGFWRFQIRLEEPAVFPQLRGDPNTVASADYIPGSSIHGALAHAYLRNNNHQADDDFRAIFTSGEVVFGNACAGVRMPHSIREFKDGGGFADLTAGREKDLRRRGGYVDWKRLESGSVRFLSVAKELHYHHARASEPRYERAIGEEQAQKMGLKGGAEVAGAFFQYESLTKGQEFEGEIRFSEAVDRRLRERVRALIGSGDTLDLGRSKSAQYGGRGVWQWLPGANQAAEFPAECKSITVLALSPVIARNREGHAVARFPVEELAKELKVSLREETQFCRSEWQGGYLGGLPLAQTPAWSAGSVLVLSSTETIAEEDFRRAAKRSYGLKRQHGFGVVQILPRATVLKSAGKLVQVRDKNSGQTVAPESEGARRIAGEIFLKEVWELAKSHAVWGSEVEVRTPRSLLHRVRLMIAAQPEKDFRRSVQGLKKPARRHLEATMLSNTRGPSRGQTLFEVLQNDWSELGSWLSDEVRKREVWSAVFGEKLVKVGPDSGRFYLQALLAALSKRAMKEKEHAE